MNKNYRNEKRKAKNQTSALYHAGVALATYF
jgi:hypothetical protein